MLIFNDRAEDIAEVRFPLRRNSKQETTTSARTRNRGAG